MLYVRLTADYLRSFLYFPFDSATVLPVRALTLTCSLLMCRKRMLRF